MMKKYQGNSVLVIILIIAVLVLAFWWFMKSGYKLPLQTAQNGENAPAITNTGGLDSASKNLDNVNLNQMDAGINQISSDSSSF